MKYIILRIRSFLSLLPIEFVIQNIVYFVLIKVITIELNSYLYCNLKVVIKTHGITKTIRS